MSIQNIASKALIIPETNTRTSPWAQAKTGPEGLANPFSADKWAETESLGSVSLNRGETPATPTTGGTTLAQGSWSKNASLFDAGGDWSDGPITASGSLDLGQVNADGNGQISGDLRDGTLNAGVNGSASAYLVAADGQADAKYQVLGLDSSTVGSGYADAGAEVDGNADASVDLLHGTADAAVHADGFAGVAAGGQITESVGPASGTIGGRVEAGIGAQFDASAGIKDGDLGFSLNMGACLGVGADWNINGNVNFGELASDAGHIASGVGGKISHAASHVASDVAKFFSGW